MMVLKDSASVTAPVTAKIPEVKAGDVLRSSFQLHPTDGVEWRLATQGVGEKEVQISCFLIVI